MTRQSPLKARLGEDDPLPPDNRVCEGARASSESLYRRHRSRLLDFISRRHCPDQAPDILQRVFVRFLGLDGEKVAQIAAPEPYLRTAANNLIRDDRKMAIRRSASLHIPEDDAALTAPCQIAALEARDMLNRIEAAMLKLKPITREIFLAHRLDGFSYAQIAERTGLSQKGVEKHMSRAIAHLDRLLSKR